MPRQVNDVTRHYVCRFLVYGDNPSTRNDKERLFFIVTVFDRRFTRPDGGDGASP